MEYRNKERKTLSFNVQKAITPRSRCHQIWCPVRAHVIIHKWTSFCYVLTWQKQQEISAGFPVELIHFFKAPPSWPHHFPKAPYQNTITMRYRLQLMIFGKIDSVIGGTKPQYLRMWLFWGDQDLTGVSKLKLGY